MQFGFVALFSFIVSLLFENPMLPQTSSSFISILLLSVFCTAIAFIVQTIAQQYTTPTSTGLIFSLEPVSSAFFAYMIAGEVLTTRGYIGAIILLSGIFLSEIDIKSFYRKKDSLHELTT
ncbi:MAG: DMT family transporter, partial [Candidatus Sericytochromatia bacterium]